MENPPVGIIMGSQSDWATMREAATLLDELGIAYETKIVSAHRTPGCGAMAKLPLIVACRSSSLVRAVLRICPA